MTNEVFEHYMNKYSYYIDIRQRIMNIEKDQIDSTIEFVIEKIEEYNIDIDPIYEMIYTASEVKIAHIQAYWKLFDAIFRKFRISPRITLSNNLIKALYAKKCKNPLIKLGIYGYSEELSFDDLLNLYQSKPIMNCIMHDDIKSLKDIINSTLEFDFNQRIERLTLIQNSCLCGSLECFRFLRSNGVEIDRKCLEMSIDGQNKQIIDECLQYCYPDTNTMRECIKVLSLDSVINFHERYDLQIYTLDTINCINLEVYLYMMFSTNDYASFIDCGVLFGIPSLVQDIVALGTKITLNTFEIGINHKLFKVLKILDAIYNGNKALNQLDEDK